jgi:hypothetical protein
VKKKYRKGWGGVKPNLNRDHYGSPSCSVSQLLNALIDCHKDVIKENRFICIFIADIIIKEVYSFLCQIWDIEDPEFGYDKVPMIDHQGDMLREEYENRGN